MPPGLSPGCVPFSHLLVMLTQLCMEQALGRLQACVKSVLDLSLGLSTFHSSLYLGHHSYTSHL